MIKYEELKGCPSSVRRKLPELETLGELQNYLYSLEAELVNMENQLIDFERFSVWPKGINWEGHSWDGPDEWLEATITAKRLTTWGISVVKATLNKMERYYITDRRITVLEEKVTHLTHSILEDRNKKCKLLNSIREAVDKLPNSNRVKTLILTILDENNI